MLPMLLVDCISIIFPLYVCHRMLRMVTIWAGVTISICIFVTDLVYFTEYQDQFNHWIFGIIYDDRTAIFKTIWKSYPIIWLAIGIFAAIQLVGRCFTEIASNPRIQINLPKKFSTGFFRFFIILFILVFIAVGTRGSLGSRPIQLKDSSTTGNAFLNKLVMNPFVALKYAITQHRMLQSAAGLKNFLPDGDITVAMRAQFPLLTTPKSLDDYLAQVSLGHSTKPTHIILVVMESYDAWTMDSKFEELGLTKNLAQMGREGIQSNAFVSAADGTMPSLTAIITGLPYTDVNANYQSNTRRIMATSIAPIFKRLGYRPRFFYGGYLSWQRLGSFVSEQGFEDVYGGDQMSSDLTGNEWGVDDEDLFHFVLDHTGNTPTFDMIMTTSYHPPFSVDLKAKGFQEDVLKKTKIGSKLSPNQINIYGHLWYADHALGVFWEEYERRFEKPLIAVTGDHFSRRYPSDSHPTLFERKAVPLVFSGRDVLSGIKPPIGLVGSHIDIVPTLIHFASQEGFSYHSSGRDLLDTTQQQIGFGAGVVIGGNFIFEINNPTAMEDLQGNTIQSFNTKSLTAKYNILHALSWWRIMKGNLLPAQKLQ
jgi:phosphoglycerol transferase MdoB-like AlkP superfamily enzyme